MVYSNADNVIKYGTADMTPDDGEMESKVNDKSRPGSTSHVRSASNSKAPRKHH